MVVNDTFNVLLVCDCLQYKKMQYTNHFARLSLTGRTKLIRLIKFNDAVGESTGTLSARQVGFSA